jgi:oxalate decarboxylase
MSNPTLPSFRYRLEQQPAHTSCGGLVRGASVRQFHVSQGIGGASMRLQPGCLRELHWHTTAAELGYVVSGSCRTTVLSPEGAATDTFGPGDVWCFPRGWGHSIQGTGPSECHFVLMFDNGAFAEDHTLSISDWLAHTSPAVVSQSLGLGMEWTAKLPKGEIYFAEGAVPEDSFARAAPPGEADSFNDASLSIRCSAAAARAGRRRAVDGCGGRVSDLDHIVCLRAGDRAGCHA